MSDTEWIITFTTQSAKPCAACRALEAGGPYVHVEDRVAAPDPDIFRPHSNCECYVDIDGGALLEESDYTVRDLKVQIDSGSENQDFVRTHVNPSNSATRSVSVSETDTVEVNVSVSTGYTVEGIGGIEAGLSASSSTSSGGEQSVELEPRTRVNEYLHTLENTATITGTLYDATGKALGPTYVGTANQTIKTYYLDDIEDM